MGECVSAQNDLDQEDDLDRDRPDPLPKGKNMAYVQNKVWARGSKTLLI